MNKVNTKNILAVVAKFSIKFDAANGEETLILKLWSVKDKKKK